MDDTKEVALNGHAYRVGRLAPMTQFHVARRLAPVLLQVVNVKDLAGAASAAKDDPTQALAALGGLATALRQLSDDDSEYIVNACLDVVTRQQGERWARVRATGGLMFQDIDLNVMLSLTYEVVVDNLGSFFQGNQLMSNSAEA